MRPPAPRLVVLMLLLGFVLLAAAPPPELARGGMVAADHVLASRAGASVMAAGGNAIDGVVAAALAAGVVQPSASGLGGGGFAVVVTAQGDPSVLDFREVAPAAATREMFLNAPDGASRDGGLAVAVPSEGPGLEALQRRFGALPWRAVVAPALELARDGFPAGWHLVHALDESRGDGAGLSLAMFGAPTPQVGELLRRRALASTLRALSRHGAKALTTGPVAADIVSTVQSHGGLLTAADLAAVKPRDRAPLVGTYRGWTVITMPPPSSGGVVLLQALAVLERHDLAAMGHNSSALLHLYAEVLQHAYADRARWMGDPDRVAVPVSRLLSKDRIDQVQAAFDPLRTLSPEAYGLPVDAGQDAGTQHISALDANGLAVALTTTVNTSFGSKLVTPRGGLVLNNQMDDFVARPGEPNAFGLVGSESNAVAPGARPLSSMTPTVLLSPDGARRVVVGASGGPFIISSTLQAIVNFVDFHQDPAEAVSLPRIHHQWTPRLLFIDEGVPEDVQSALRARGHTLKVMPFFSAVQLVADDGELILGASDPRKGGWAAGVP